MSRFVAAAAFVVVAADILAVPDKHSGLELELDIHPFFDVDSEWQQV